MSELSEKQLSTLIMEARPYYKQKKRRKKILLAFIVLLFPTFLVGEAINLYIAGDAAYVALKNQSLQKQLIQDDFGLLGSDN